jgi:hypothetical protein
MLNLAQIYTETVTITVAGTAQNPTAANVPDGVAVVVLSHPDNTGSIKVADTAAKAQAALGVGNVPLAGSVASSFQIQDPSILYLDATVSGEKAIIYFEL